MKFYEIDVEAKRFGRLNYESLKIKKQELIYGMRQIQSNLIKAVLDRTGALF
jgi:hypothetical protein